MEERIAEIRKWLQSNKLYYFDTGENILITETKPEELIDYDFPMLSKKPEELIDIDFDLDFYNYFKKENDIKAPDFIKDFFLDLKRT